MVSVKTVHIRRLAGSVGGALAALALAAPAGADVVLGARGVEGVARRVARHWGEPDPTRIEYASGSLAQAMTVVGSGRDSTLNLHTTAPGTPGSLVDVVAVKGHFSANVSVPRGSRPPTGTVMELVIDAHSAFVEVRRLSDRLPAPLSRLGPVRRLGAGPGGPRLHAR
jgi:hypothetical protein